VPAEAALPTGLSSFISIDGTHCRIKNEPARKEPSSGSSWFSKKLNKAGRDDVSIYRIEMIDGRIVNAQGDEGYKVSQNK
jgi:hypothetical protein